MLWIRDIEKKKWFEDIDDILMGLRQTELPHNIYLLKPIKFKSFGVTVITVFITNESTLSIPWEKNFMLQKHE